MRPLLSALSSGWLIFSWQPVWGGPSDIAVRISCPALSDLSAAEFEARAKLDLSARSTRGGELEIVCDDLAARIRWRERGRAWFARSMPPSTTPASFVDALLVASKELVDEASRFEKSVSGDALKDPSTTPDAIPPSPADASSSAESERMSDPAAERSQTGDRPRDRADARETAETPSDHRGAGPATPVEWTFGVFLGTQAALFSFSGTGIAGPNVGVFVDLQRGITASLAGEYDVAVGAGDIASVRVASGAAVIAARFGPARAFEVGVGALAGSVFASSELPYQPASQSQGFWGGLVRGRYAPRMNAWRFAVGPEMRFYGFRPDVAVDGAAVWGVPVLSVGIALEVSRELLGSPR